MTSKFENKEKIESHAFYAVMRGYEVETTAYGICKYCLYI